jgi:hypothetical protein
MNLQLTPVESVPEEAIDPKKEETAPLTMTKVEEKSDIAAVSEPSEANNSVGTSSRLQEIIKYSEILAKQALETFDNLPKIEDIVVPEVPDINSRSASSISYLAKSVADYQSMVGSKGSPVTPSSSTEPGSSFRDILRASIAEQESSNSYDEISPKGALGKYQVMPDNFIEGKGAENNWGLLSGIGRSDITQKEFIANHDLQEKMFEGMFFKFFNNAKDRGASQDDAIRYAATSWYSGEQPARVNDQGKFVPLPTDSAKQANGPTITKYANDIIARVKAKTSVPAKGLSPAAATQMASNRQYVQQNSTPALMEFHNKYELKSVDVDGIGYEGVLGQCVDYVIKYGEYIGKPILGGVWYATDYSTTKEGRRLMSNHYNPIDKFQELSPGDVFTQSPKQVGNNAGHIGIALTKPDADGFFWVTQQNAHGFSGKVSSGRTNIKALNGVWRPR